MLRIDPSSTAIPKLHRLLLGAIAPRPIAFASTIDEHGNPNLSPFSFFNAFGVNPTTLIFSPSRRGRDNTVKHTYENVKIVPEVVINVVNFNMVQQVSLSSTEYPKGVNEFTKAGLTPLRSEKVRPFRVAESPVQFECRVREVIETGDQGGAANLVVCEILMIHINEEVLNEAGEIDIEKIDLVGRLGGDYYCRTSGDSKFLVAKPLQRLGIGVDALPEEIRLSETLTGNDLGQLGNIEKLPGIDELNRFKTEPEYLQFRTIAGSRRKVHELAKELIAKNKVEEALKVLLAK